MTSDLKQIHSCWSSTVHIFYPWKSLFPLIRQTQNSTLLQCEDLVFQGNKEVFYFVASYYQSFINNWRCQKSLSSCFTKKHQKSPTKPNTIRFSIEICDLCSCLISGECKWTYLRSSNFAIDILLSSRVYSWLKCVFPLFYSHVCLQSTKQIDI